MAREHRRTGQRRPPWSERNSAGHCDRIPIRAVANASYDLDTFSATTFTSIIASSGNAGDDVSFSNLTSTQAGAISIVADMDDVTFASKDFTSGGTSDTAKITLGDGTATDVDVGGPLTFTQVDVLNIDSKSDGTPTAGEQHSIAGLTATDLDKIVVTGDNAIAITTAAGTTALTEVDASALTGALELDTSGTAITQLLVKSTSKADTIDVSNNGTAVTIDMAGGDDALTIDTGQASTLRWAADSLSSAALVGAEITVATATAAGDLILNFNSAIEGLLKIGGQTVTSLAADTNVGGTLNANNNIAYTEAGGNSIIQIDLNGDGVYNAADDFQVTITGGAGTLANLTYVAASDWFVTA